MVTPKDEEKPPDTKWFQEALAKARSIAAAGGSADINKGTLSSHWPYVDMNEYSACRFTPSPELIGQILSVKVIQGCQLSMRWQEKRVLIRLSLVSPPVDVGDVEEKHEEEEECGQSQTMTTDDLDLTLPTVVDELASLVAVNGDQVETLVREKNDDDEEQLLLISTIRLYLKKINILNSNFLQFSRQIFAESRRRFVLEIPGQNRATPAGSPGRRPPGEEADPLGQRRGQGSGAGLRRVESGPDREESGVDKVRRRGVRHRRLGRGPMEAMPRSNESKFGLCCNK